MTAPHCFLCGNAQLEVLDARAALCRHCNLLINTETAPVDYRELGSSKDPGKMHWRLVNCQCRLAILEPHLTDHRALVDIGCGSGQMLLAAAQRLPLRMGFEANASLVEYDREHYGLHVENAYFAPQLLSAEMRAAPKVFTLSHVVEHVADPLGLLQTVREAMNPGDLLYIEVPLFTGRSFRDKKYAWSLWYHEHLCLYSLEALAVLARGSGLETATSGTRIFARGSHSNKTRLRLLRQNPLVFLRTLLTKPSYLSLADVMIGDYGFVVLRKP